MTKFAHPVTLEPEVTGGWYSGLWTSYRMYTLCTKYENNWKWCIVWVCDFTWNDPKVTKIISFFDGSNNIFADYDNWKYLITYKWDGDGDVHFDWGYEEIWYVYIMM